MDRPILEINNLNVSFSNENGSVHVIRGVDLQVRPGEIVGLVGESGSGKSVSMYSVMRLSGPTAQISGQISFDGKDVSDPDKQTVRELRRSIGVIFQDPMTTLNPVFTIGSQMRNAMNGRDMTRDEKNAEAERLLELVGIPDAHKRMKQYPHEFSGGQRQRIVIAMALAGDPKLLLADEPTTALDVTVQAQILELIKKLAKEMNMSVVLVTHDLGVIAEMCSYVYVLYAGRVCEAGPVEDIFYRPKHEYTKGLLRAMPNPNGGDRLQPIGGTVVNLSCMPEGCAFAQRCPEAMRICAEQQPENMSFGPGHRAECWMNCLPEKEEEQ